MSSPAPTRTVRSTTGPLRIYRPLNGLVLLGVVLQGISAGIQMARLGGADWTRIHQVTGYAVMLLALAAAVLAALTLRQRHPGMVAWSAVLAALLIGQAVIGERISEGGSWALIAIHVPLALIIMAVAAYLSLAAARPAESGPGPA